MTKNGLVVGGQGWFVVNARESRWRDVGPLGAYCNFEGKKRFPQLGININVLAPGQAMGMYHKTIRATLPRSTFVSYRPGWLPEED